LTSLALGRGGLTARDAVARAEKAIDANSAASLASIDAALRELETRFGAASADGSVGDYEGLYLLAGNIIDVSGCLRGSFVDKAAYALCDLADVSAELRVWDRQAVSIHIQVLQLLRTGGAALTEVRRKRLVEGLYKVAAKRIGTIEAGPGRAGA
jgi:hypothetical protein